MEPSSAATCILLTVSLFIFRSPPIIAQLTIESVPINAVRGDDVLLRVLRNLPADPFTYYWYKGETADILSQITTYTVSTGARTKGPAYNGRKTIYPNGSLLFQNVTLEEQGPYTLQIINSDVQLETAIGQIHVYELVTKPSIRASNILVKEHSGPMVMTCVTNHTDISIRWVFEGHSLQLTEGMTLSLNNSSLTINIIRREDAGNYQCEVSNPVSSRKSDPFSLTVECE
ncbi:PREDICTED: carcinoembryonic antigen-related cell adhesion molecule 21-like [Elephantulus edwardii]|uniref:carcinoembryonic antigen-related cell adhesion molecule 21-like n=1 Tax=Elephantulus edwardii TaxID=28737 RepID=UPI0003F08DA5|nr:PREDICTED: carcinoembryonic antigen-related cell adhesion molecule 21-like [Elephantulus edwardii]